MLDLKMQTQVRPGTEQTAENMNRMIMQLLQAKRQKINSTDRKLFKRIEQSKWEHLVSLCE